MASWLIAFAVSLAWCVASLWIGPRLGFVDRPERSSLTAHESAAVPLGGVGVFLGVHLGSLSVGRLDLPLLIGSSIVLVLGLVDDRVGLSPVARLGVEVVAATSIVATGAYGGGIAFQLLAVVLMVLAINAVNLYDGLDGLAGSTAAVTAFGVAVVLAGRGLDALAPVELAAALAGFLILNWHPARVFLGDSGSYVTGIVIAHLVLTASSPSLGEALVTSAMFGLFFIDLIASVVRRLRSSSRLFEGDRNHLYDQLRRSGLSVPAVAVASATIQAVLVGLVVAVTGLDTAVALTVIAIALAAILLLLWRWGALSPGPG